MRVAQDPKGVDFGPAVTIPPEGAPDPCCGRVLGQFGVENNQVRVDGSNTGMTLEEKAQMDLANKVGMQGRQF